jgi:hypothetical protein
MGRAYASNYRRDNDVACAKAMEKVRIWEQRAATLG